MKAKAEEFLETRHNEKVRPKLELHDNYDGVAYSASDVVEIMEEYAQQSADEKAYQMYKRAREKDLQEEREAAQERYDAAIKYIVDECGLAPNSRLIKALKIAAGLTKKE